VRPTHGSETRESRPVGLVEADCAGCMSMEDTINGKLRPQVFLRMLRLSLRSMGSEFPSRKPRKKRSPVPAPKEAREREEVMRLLAQLDPRLYPVALAGISNIVRDGS
jgi:hypothetical protein